MTRLFTTSLALAALGALGACTTDSGDEGLFVSRVLAPSADCTFSVSETENFLGTGDYALDAAGNYHVHVQIESRITATDENAAQRTVQLRGIRSTITCGDGSAIPVDEALTDVGFLVSGPVGPNGGLTDVGIDIVPAKLSQAVAANNLVNDSGFKASFEVYGDMDGDEVRSQRFVFPFQMYRGIGPQNVGTCPLPYGSVVHTSSNGCSLYAEDYTDCCQDGDQLLCPAVVSTEMPTN